MVERLRGFVSCCAFNIQFVVSSVPKSSKELSLLPSPRNSICRQQGLGGSCKDECECFIDPK